MPYRPIIVTRNAAKCLDCNDVIESRSRHDFVRCSCGNIFVDGGLEYLRTGYSNDNWVDLSESHEGEERLYHHEWAELDAAVGDGEANGDSE